MSGPGGSALEQWLDPDPEHVSRARHFAAGAVAALGGDDDAQDTVRMLVSELVTNVVLHAGTRAVLTVVDADDAVRVSVTDGSAAVPQQRRITRTSTTGRGLRLLRSLSVESGTHPDAAVAAGGKSVWFTVPKVATDARREELALAALDLFDAEL